MGKIEKNKQQKSNSILSTAFHLFTTQGVDKTSIAEISEKAGVAKGTFYLYFKDKYDIRNKLIAHESSKLFSEAMLALKESEREINSESDFEDRIVFFADYIINELSANKALLSFISKNLSWGLFKKALTSNISENDINFEKVYFEMIEQANCEFDNPEIMLFQIVELINSTCHSSILNCEPTEIESMKPYIFRSIRAIIRASIVTVNN